MHWDISRYNHPPEWSKTVFKVSLKTVYLLSFEYNVVTSDVVRSDQAEPITLEQTACVAIAKG